METQKLIKKCRRIRVLIKLAGIAVMLTVMWLMRASVLFYAAGLIAYVAVTSVLASIMNIKLVAPILSHELDPKKYLEVVSAVNKRPCGIGDTTIGSYGCFDYQTTVNVCTGVIKNGGKKRYVIACIVYLARVCFDTGDIAGLAELCERFDATTAQFKDGEKLRRLYVVMDYYKLWVKGEYSRCADMYAGLIGSELYNRSPLQSVSVDYLYAAALYKTGDTDRAKQIFESIAVRAPKMNYARIAELHLKAIAAGEQYSCALPKPTPDESYVVPASNSNRKRIIILLVGIAVVTVLLALLGI